MATWLPALLLVVCGAVVLVRFGPATDLSRATLVPSFSVRDALFLSTIAFAFGGLEAPSFLGAEMRDPRRDLPRALLLAGALITGVYLAGTAAILVAIPAREASGLDGITKAIVAACARAGLPPLGGVAALLITLSGVGVTGAWLAASARLPFVGGLDRFLPPVFGRVDPRWGTPAVAILVQSLLSLAFVLLSQAGTGVKGAYDALVAMSVVAYFVPFLFLFAATIRLNSEAPPPGAFRVPGGRPVSVLLACVGFATTALSLGLRVRPAGGRPGQALRVREARRPDPAAVRGGRGALDRGAPAARAGGARDRRLTAILFEDADVLAVDKPSGVSMATSARAGVADAAVRRLLAACGEEARDPLPLLVHRLDVGTSGVVLLAKNRRRAPGAVPGSAAEDRAEDLPRPRVGPPGSGPRPESNCPLARDPKDGRKMTRRKGRQAVRHELRDAAPLHRPRGPAPLSRDGAYAPDPRPPRRERAPDRGRRLLRRRDALAGGPGRRRSARRSGASRALSSTPSGS